MMRTLRKRAKELAMIFLITLGCLLLMEGGLRLFWGLPRGYFHFRPLDDTGLYLPNQAMYMGLGPIPYIIRTNSLGFRGPEIEEPKGENTFRIVMVGDSITDGFYVDNEDTYPFQLGVLLKKTHPDVEVVNAARGGVSIDREFEIVRKFCIPIEPDLIVLTFVSNDIDDIRGIDRERLVTLDSREFQPASRSEALFFARTAIGELLLDWSMRLRYQNYRRYHGGPDSPGWASRYEIPGGENIGENIRVFMEKHVKRNDGIVAYHTFSPAQEKVVDNYLYALEHLNTFCRDRHIPLVFVYFPDYNQVYDPKASFILPEKLKQGCEVLGIPYYDVTPALRRAAKDHVLHLAPLDFHLNPEGNRALAGGVAKFLRASGLLLPAGSG